jgi:Leucine-rich repeat (LRR) protein
MHNGSVTELPESIGNLHTLKQLYVTGNRLVSLPKSIGKLWNLKILNTSANLLTTLPKEIANLENLESLDISQNSIPLTDNFVHYSKYMVKYDKLEALKCGGFGVYPGDSKYTRLFKEFKNSPIDYSQKWSGIKLSELIKELVN